MADLGDGRVSCLCTARFMVDWNYGAAFKWKIRLTQPCVVCSVGTSKARFETTNHSEAWGVTVTALPTWRGFSNGPRMMRVPSLSLVTRDVHSGWLVSKFLSKPTDLGLSSIPCIWDFRGIVKEVHVTFTTSSKTSTSSGPQTLECGIVSLLFLLIYRYIKSEALEGDDPPTPSVNMVLFQCDSLARATHGCDARKIHIIFICYQVAKSTVLRNIS